MKRVVSILLCLGTLAVSGCGGGGGTSSSGDGAAAVAVSGTIQKGPYLNGATVTIFELNDDLAPTGRSFNTQTNSMGQFDFPTVSLRSSYVEIKAEGYYFNEVSGANSDSPLTLYAIANSADRSTINVNLMTHIERARVKALIANDASFADAKKQAQREVLQIFEINKSNAGASETLDISKDGEDNAILLAISSILQGNRTVAEVSELIANISDDIRDNGVLVDPVTGSALTNSAKFINSSNIKTNLENRYKSIGAKVTVPDTSAIRQNFLDKAKFQPTDLSIYPAVGAFGPNVLHESVTDYEIGKVVSLSAILPNQNSLRVEIRGESDNWSFAPFESSGWQWGDYNFTTHSRTFTSNQTGAIDLKLMLGGIPLQEKGTLTFFVYENGSQSPTWTKTLTPK